MILEVSPDSSILVRAAAAAVLFLHIAGGSIGILSGAAAIIVRKGSASHRAVGNAFFVSMLIMATIGATVSPFLPKPQWVNVIAGSFTFYLVATAWATARHRGQVGLFEKIAFAGGIVIAVGAPVLGMYASNVQGASGAEAGSFVFAIIAALAAAGDYRMIRSGGISGTPRLVRHLWRMLLALLIASASLFLGQPQLFSPAVHQSRILFVPELAIVGALIYWLIRVRGDRKPKNQTRLASIR